MLLVTHLNLSGNHSIIHLFFVLSPFHLNYCCTIPLLSSNSSDHKGLLVLLHNDVVIKRPFSNSSRTVWCCSQANCDLACNLNESDWNSMFSNASNVNQLWFTWQKRFLEIMEICIPQKAWLSPSLLSAIKRRNSPFRSFKFTGSVN